MSRLMARYRIEGDAAFEPRSRRPRTSPTKVSDVLNERIVNLRVDLTSRGLDAGPTTKKGKGNFKPYRPEGPPAS